MLNRLYNWYGKRVVRVTLTLIIILLVVGAFVTSRTSVPTNERGDADEQVVELQSVSALSGVGELELIGTVEAVEEAKLQTEVAGRITSVGVELGQFAAAGTVIAQIENARERATVLQAEGAYEAALAARESSNISTTDAEDSYVDAREAGKNSYKSAYTSIDNIMGVTVDRMFRSPDFGNSAYILSAGIDLDVSEKRESLRVPLESWTESVLAGSPGEAGDLLAEALNTTRNVASLVDAMFEAAADEKYNNESVSGVDMESHRIALISAREQINGVINSIEASEAAIRTSLDALEQARIQGTGGSVSLGDASVKQALGSLRAAQASLGKTIFRTPIAGTVNTLDVKVGDYVANFAPIATVANNDALLVTVFVGDREREFIDVGDEVKLDDSATGLISNISPAFDATTGKIEVKISTESETLQNGDVIRVQLLSGDTEVDEDMVLNVPITAVKLTADAASVFTVENGVLVAQDVELGRINGSYVELSSGVTGDTVIVTDARGLSDGQRVNVKE